MRRNTNFLYILIGLFSILLVDCSTNAVAKREIHEFLVSTKPGIVGKNTATPVIPITITLMISTPTYRSSATNTPQPTNTPVPTQTLTNPWHPAGGVIAPILLFHHVSDDEPKNRYYVTLENFRNQLRVLHDWGCKTITASDLAEVIVHGGELPPRSVVITFDDGYEDVFQNAFPIMQEMGFIGVIYIYVEQIGLNGYVDPEQIITLANNGWEIGSHSMSHADLTQNHSKLAFEIQESRSTLQETFGAKVDTFAYPYGKTDQEVIRFIKDSNYLAGMGLGLNWHRTLDSLFDLSRIEIAANTDIPTFISLFPWTDD